MTDIQFIEQYFTEEKIESLYFLIIGIISVFLAFIFLGLIKYSFYKGFAYPLLLIGFIQIMVGFTIYKRSPEDITRVNIIVTQQPQKIVSEELPRMEQVMKNFELYKWIEYGFIVIGLVLIIYFFSSPLTFWKGFGLGLLMQSSLMLALDLMAAARASYYIDDLSKVLLN